METLGKFGILVLLLVIIAMIMAWPLMYLWNWLMPLIFHLITITFWQALGLNIMTGILFRSYDAKTNND